MDKEDVAHVYTMEYYSAIKKNEIGSFAEIYRDVDGPRVCRREWSKSEREKQISYINTYMLLVILNREDIHSAPFEIC